MLINSDSFHYTEPAQRFRAKKNLAEARLSQHEKEVLIKLVHGVFRTRGFQCRVTREVFFVIVTDV
jgi:hypothetical protein